MPIRRRGDMGVGHIWFAIVTGSVVVFLVDLFFYKRGVWMRQKLNLD